MSRAPTFSSIHISRRHGPKRRPLSMLASGASLASLTPLAAGAGMAPQLVMAEPDDPRSAIIAGSLTTVLHASGIGMLVLLAWLAPPIAEIIEVKIIRELPGADEEPAPARKLLKPRRQQELQAARQIITQAVVQPRVLHLTAEQLKMARLNKAKAPQQVQRRQVVSTRTRARSIDYRVLPTYIDPSQLDNVVVTDLEVPIYDYQAPREIQAVAPEELAKLPEVADVRYESAAPFEIVSDRDLDADMEVYDFDTDVGVYAGGEGTGGTGTALGVVRCFESAFVLRYIDNVEARTKKRWRVPEETPDEAKVVLLFTLDSSGAATKIAFRGDVDPALGNSAVGAMRAASPFPPMDDNVRCLAGKKLRGTFSNPAM